MSDLRQIKTLKQWADKYVSYDIDAESTLDQAYRSYVKYITFEDKQIGLSKRTFSKYFKEYLIPKVDKGHVKQIRKSQIIFLGLFVVENEELLKRMTGFSEVEGK